LVRAERPEMEVRRFDWMERSFRDVRVERFW
jgi:hypothetical protein